MRIFGSTIMLAVHLAGTGVSAQIPGMPQAKQFPWSDPKLSPDVRANLVIKEMTLDEKILLLHGNGLGLSHTPPAEWNGGAGFVSSIPRLGIPSIQMADSAYGVTLGFIKGRYSTALPSNLAAACSWDTDAAFEYGALLGRELRNEGYNMSLGGGVNLAREPRNGRTFEYLGEDPLLAGTLDGYVEKGVQSEYVIGDVKHYAMNDQESGRNAVDVHVDKRAMRETDLRAFEIALRISDAGGVMCSYNRVNGDYACENSYLLSDVLKKDFNFKGFVLSDWGATHSTIKASHAGLDMEQQDANFFGDSLKKAVEDGEVSQQELDDHVHRILRTIFANGLFDAPFVHIQVPDVEKGYEVAQETEEKSIVLLRNERHILPLSRDLKSVALIGGHADVGVLSGGGSAQVSAPGGSPVPPPPFKSIYDLFNHQEWMPSSPLRALKAKLPSTRVTYISGDDLAAAASVAKSADVAIVFAYQWEAENSDLPTLDLAPEQNKLIEAVAAANPRTIVVLETGSPATMPWIDQVEGVVEAWYPGIRGAEALAETLTGAVNPSGKLAISFPKSDADLPHPKIVQPPPESQQLVATSPADMAKEMEREKKGLPPFPIQYDEGLKVGYKWYDAEHKDVLFPFGFGLSYTAYSYSGLSIMPGDTTSVTFTVKNTGERAGTEIAQVYSSLPEAAGEPPKRLVGWIRVALKPGESKQVSVPLARDRFTIYDEASDSWKLVPGNYVVRVGGSSQDLPLQQPITF